LSFTKTLRAALYACASAIGGVGDGGWAQPLRAEARRSLRLANADGLAEPSSARRRSWSRIEPGAGAIPAQCRPLHALAMHQTQDGVTSCPLGLLPTWMSRVRFPSRAPRFPSALAALERGHFRVHRSRPWPGPYRAVWCRRWHSRRYLIRGSVEVREAEICFFLTHRMGVRAKGEHRRGVPEPTSRSCPRRAPSWRRCDACCAALVGERPELVRDGEA